MSTPIDPRQRSRPTERRRIRRVPRRRPSRLGGLAACVLAAGAADARAGWWADLWRTPDQQAQRAFDSGDFAGAAAAFTDPMRRGVARFRAGDFEAAAAEFGRVTGAEGHFNRGNALVMLGKYEEAAEAYGRSLAARPDWPEAEENRELALARADLLAPAEDDAGGTEAQLEPDEIVFDEQGKKGERSEPTEEAGAGAELSQQEIEALWMRRLQPRPADFLRAKFAYQSAREEAGAPDAEENAGEEVPE